MSSSDIPGHQRVTSSAFVALSRRSRSVLFALLGTLILVTGCDTSVQALDPSEERHYSVFGVVNPGQDTQWVRVEPLPEPTSSGAPREIDATVTLENLSTGQEWTLRDSLMEVFRDEFQHNFWTTAPIAPGTSYRLVVSNTDGDSTWATTTTPSVPPSIDVLEEILLPCRESAAANVFEVRIETEELAALQVRYAQTFLGVSQIFDFDSYDDATRTEGAYMAQINYREDLITTNRTPGQECIVDAAWVVAFAGGPDWPEWARFNDATISQVARPDSFTNVEEGLGMFGGVYSDTAEVEVDQRNPSGSAFP